ncbi:MAG: type IV pilus assembly protein PilM [Phycisphaerae bacterium]
MASSSVSWGIEIGAAAIKAVKLEATGDGGVRLLEYANIQHPKPLSTPDINPNDVLRVSLGALTSQHDLSKAQIAISVPGHSAFARFAKLPPVEPKKVPDIVKFEAMQQIPFPLEQVEWDYQTFVTPDSPDVEVGIFAITREKVMERLSMLEEFGIAPSHVVLSPIAVYNALAYDLGFDENAPGTIIVDVGTTSTDLVIATPGRMWVRTFPIGGHQFTEGLVEQFSLSYAKAEKLKREAEDSTHARQIFQAMRPSFANLAQDIQRSIGYYQSLNRDAELTRLIGVGSTFLLPGLRKFLKQQLSIDVYRVEEFKKIKADGDAQQRFNDVSLNFATAYGLALQGLGLNAVGGNLMPVSVLRRSMWREKVPYFGIAAGIAVAAGASMFLFPLRDGQAARENQPPMVVREAADKFKQLKAEADAAGVLAAIEPDTKAAGLMAMLDRRHVFQQLTADVQSLLEAAESRRAGWATEQQVKEVPGPAFVVKSVVTEYLQPVAVAEGDPAAQGGEAAPDPLHIAAFPRIACTITLHTDQPEADKFVRDVGDRWMRTLKARQGLAFTVVAPDRWASVKEEKAGDEGGQASLPGTGGGGRGAFGGALAPGAERGVRRISGSEDGVVMLPDGTMGQLSKRIQGAILVGGADGPEVIGQATGSKREADAAADVEKLADLAALGAKSEPPRHAASVTGTWYIVFKPAASGETHDGGAK